MRWNGKRRLLAGALLELALLGALLGWPGAVRAQTASPATAALCAAATHGATIRVDPQDCPLQIDGLPSTDGTLQGTMRLSAPAGPISRFLLLASDLHADDPSLAPIPRQRVTLVGEATLPDTLPHDFPIQISGLQVPGTYTGSLVLLTPTQTLTEAITVPLVITVRVASRLNPIEGSDTLNLNLVHCLDFLDCPLAHLLLPDSAFITGRQLQFENPTLASVALSNVAVAATGARTGFQLPVQALHLPAPAPAVAANGIFAVPLTIDSTSLPPDQYRGNLYLTLAGHTDRLRVPIDINVRVGPLWPLLVLLLGILAGTIFRYLQGRGGQVAVAVSALNQLRVRLHDQPAEEPILRPRVLGASEDIALDRLDQANATVQDLNVRLDLLVDLRHLETQLAGVATADSRKQTALAQIGQARTLLEQPGTPALNTAGQLRDAAQTVLTALLQPAPDRATRGGTFDGERGLDTQPATPPAPAPPPRDVIGTLLRWGRDVWVWCIWIASKLVGPVLLLGLAMLGLQKFYIDAGQTFGAEPFSDYLGLFLWGLTANVATTSLTAFATRNPLPTPATGSVGGPGSNPPPGAPPPGAQGGGTRALGLQAGGRQGGNTKAGESQGGGAPAGGSPHATAAEAPPFVVAPIPPPPDGPPPVLPPSGASPGAPAVGGAADNSDAAGLAARLAEGTVQPTTASATNSPTYHVLLIGIDNYPLPNTLRGCVSDIVAVENLLLDGPGVGLPAQNLRLTRLAAPGVGKALPAHPAVQTGDPTRAGIIAALRALAADPVKPGDRVLIYYSGHGVQTRWTTTGEWHEGLVPRDLQFIYDLEVNTLINDIAARLADPAGQRAPDLTVILDCCHSAGATRALEAGQVDPQAATRFFQIPSGADDVTPPADLIGGPAGARSLDATRLLRSPDPQFLVLAACQADQKAGERLLGAAHNGLLTRGLLDQLAGRDAAARSQVRWADIWPDMLDAVSQAGATPPPLPAQNPNLLGRMERRVFGGDWEPQDVGMQVRRNADGTYTVRAGTLMGLTAGAKLAVYGKEPLRFPPLNDPAEAQARVGTLAVQQADRSRSTATAEGAPFALPEGARARLVAAGDNQRLQVGTADQEAAARINASPLLMAAAPAAPGAEVQVTGTLQTGWTIANDIEAQVARLEPLPAPTSAEAGAGQWGALITGLEAFTFYYNALRVARNSNDAILKNSLAVRLLDCRQLPATAFAGSADGLPAIDQQLAQLPEAPKNANGVYALPTGFPFAIQITNTYRNPRSLPGAPLDTLFVTVLDGTAGGKVQYLGDVSVRSASSETVWLQQKRGQVFSASPAMGRPRATDRLLVIGTTLPDQDLRGLAWDKNVQEVIDALATRDLAVRDTLPTTLGQTQPPELWTATIVPLIIGA